MVYPWLGCGDIATCLSGDEHLCVKAARNLFHAPGGYADTARVPHEKYLVPIGSLDPCTCGDLCLRRHHGTVRYSQIAEIR